MLRSLPWVVVAPWAVWAVVRLGGWDRGFPAAQLIAFTPYVALLSLVPLVVALLMRQWIAAGVAALVVVALAFCVVPRGLPDREKLAGASGVELRVMTANVLTGNASASELVVLARDNRVDVLALQELTPNFVAELERAGMGDVLPFRVAHEETGVGGSGILSRHELRDDGLRMNPNWFGQANATLVAYGVMIESVHPVAPYGPEVMAAWRGSYANQQPATVDGPLRVLAGDFNATLDHSLLRSLISTGYRDAGAVVGAGFVGTWGPYDGDPIPAVTLDRVLADRRIGVREVRVFNLAGTDHRPVLAVLVLP